MRCKCERNNTLGVHEEAVKDAVAMKSLRTQTRNITEQTLRHFATEEIRKKMNAIIVAQVNESREVKQTMQEVQNTAQKAFEEKEAQAGKKREKKVLEELNDLIEDYRENVMDDSLCLAQITQPTASHFTTPTYCPTDHDCSGGDDL